MKPHKYRELSSRGYLPHYDPGSIPQTLVFGLSDSMPYSLVKRWKRQLAELSNDERRQELFERAEKYLDRGLGDCVLGIPKVASIVAESIQHFEMERYLLFSWVVMPNHVHIVLEPLEDFELKDIVHSIKSFTANEINKYLGRSGKLWQEDYFDRFIRGKSHFNNAIKYVEMNPVKAGLVNEKSQWRWSSAYCE